LNNYAQFLKEVKKDYNTAEGYYLRAVNSNPKQVEILYNYAYFLMTAKRDYAEAG
jgi:Tfp pilus assembly protein PilF